MSNCSLEAKFVREGKAETEEAVQSTREITPKALAASLELPTPVMEWLEDSSRALVEKATDGKALSQTELDKAQQRSKDLSTTADKVGVKFSGKAFQFLYMESKFTRRAALTYRLLKLVWEHRDGPLREQFQSTILSTAGHAKGEEAGCRELWVTSFGGGPGM